jgi:4-hydroxymandelate synthase
MAAPEENLRMDHVEIYVTELHERVEEFVATYGFEVCGRSGADQSDRRSVALRQGAALLLLTQGLDDDHPASSFVLAHGDGIGNIALRTPDVLASFDTAVEQGAKVLQAPYEQTGVLVAVIEAFGDVRHTLLERPSTAQAGLPPGIEAAPASVPPRPVGLLAVDHFAVCVEAGRLVPTVEFYRSALGFAKTFEERIVIGTQAMNSQVVQNPARDVTLTIIEPDPAHDHGQIDGFLKENCGAGVQHLAFSTDDIVASVDLLEANGVGFLTTPDSYYRLLPTRMDVAGHRVEELHQLGILADFDHAGQLYQIFTRSTHPRRTLFFEVIERLGAETFGSGNIKALYEAVQFDQTGGR